MEAVLILARSVTYAQRMERALARIRIRCAVFRAPLELTQEHGCAYAVQVEERDLANALNEFDRAGLRPVSIYRAAPKKSGEVGG